MQWSQKICNFLVFSLKVQSFSRSLKHFFLTVGLNIFRNKIPLLVCCNFSDNEKFNCNHNLLFLTLYLFFTAAQFVDLLGYFSIKILQDEKKIQNFVQEAVNVLKSQNTILSMHPNSNIYGSLSQLVEFNGYYLER